MDFNFNGLTLHLQEALLAHHGVGVDLAHVVALVGGLDVGDAQVPVLVVVPGEGEPRVFADDGVVDGEDGLCLDEYPRHLVGQKKLAVKAKQAGTCGRSIRNENMPNTNTILI